MVDVCVHGPSRPAPKLAFRHERNATPRCNMACLERGWHRVFVLGCQLLRKSNFSSCWGTLLVWIFFDVMQRLHWPHGWTLIRDNCENTESLNVCSCNWYVAWPKIMLQVLDAASFWICCKDGLKVQLDGNGASTLDTFNLSTFDLTDLICDLYTGKANWDWAFLRQWTKWFGCCFIHITTHLSKVLILFSKSNLPFGPVRWNRGK